MILIKHGAQYLLGRGMPGLIHLAALAIFSRMLSPEDYGQYTLVIAGVGLANAVIFQWLRLGLLRFWPIYDSRQEVIISTLMAGFCGLLLGSGALAMTVLVFIADPVLQMLLAFGVALLWAEALFELSQQLERSQMMPLRYGLIGLFKAITSLGIGILLVYLGYGAMGLLAGTMAGLLLPLLWEAHFYARFIGIRHIERDLLSKLLKYGLPLTATFAFGFILKSSDRILLGYFLGAGDVGLYAIGANLAQNTISMLMMIVNLAAYPLVVDALEKSGQHAATAQLDQNLTLLCAISLPAVVGVSLLAPNIAGVLLGANFRDAAALVIPVIAIGAFLAGIKAFYFDLSFQLGQSTIGQVWVTLVGALVNVCLSLLLIPLYGLIGAAYATVVAYIVGLTLSIVWGRKVFPLPVPVNNLAKIAGATSGMALALVPICSYRGVPALVGQVLVGSLVFAGLGWKLGIMQCFRVPQTTKSSCRDN